MANYDWKAAQEREKLYCSWCNKPLPKTLFGIDHSRKGGFGNYLCSGRCEIANADALDECPYSEVEAMWAAMETMDRDEYLRHCKQRGIKP